MKNQIHPAIFVVVILVVLGIGYFVFNASTQNRLDSGVKYTPGVPPSGSYNPRGTVGEGGQGNTQAPPPNMGR